MLCFCRAFSAANFVSGYHPLISEDSKTRGSNSVFVERSQRYPRIPSLRTSFLVVVTNQEVECSPPLPSVLSSHHRPSNIAWHSRQCDTAFPRPDLLVRPRTFLTRPSAVVIVYRSKTLRPFAVTYPRSRP